jgi:hypothetical protein
MRHLLVQPRSGLCNRLRVFLSARQLAAQSERKLSIAVLPDDPPAHDGRDVAALRQAVESSDPVVCIRSSQFLLANGRRSVARTLAGLQPVPCVRDAIESLAPALNADTCGVHVRRTDFSQYLPHRKQRQLPALQRYFDHLDGWTGSYFLATDGGDEVEEAFRRRYGDRLITYSKRSLHRHDTEAVQDALVDVYLLQRCRAFVGTMYSSFTDMGAVSCPKPVYVEEALAPPRPVVRA